MDLSQIISNIIILAAIFATYYWQKKKISAQETAINSMKSSMEGMKYYTDAFEVYKNTYSPEEFEKNKKWAEEKAKEGAKKTIDILNKTHAENIKASMDYISSYNKVFFALLLRTPPHLREAIINETLGDDDPLKKILMEIMRNNIKYYKPYSFIDLMDNWHLTK